MQLTPITITFLIGALCASILSYPVPAGMFLLAALVNVVLMMWALAPEEEA